MSDLPGTIQVGERTFHLTEIGPDRMLDLIEAAGEAASSGAWMRYASMVCSVSQIDAVPVLMPTTKDEVRKLAAKVGNDGIVALTAVFYPDVAAPRAEVQAAKN